MMKPKHRKRLKKLADVLKHFKEHVPRLAKSPDGYRIKHFDMNVIFDKSKACAGGVAALHPWFRKRGLKMGSNGCRIKYRKADGSYEALEKFFGLDSTPMETIFYQGYSRNAKEVARDIREYLKTNAA